jgi:hypothetical protein
MVLLERSQGTGIYFVRFGFRMGEILNLKWILSVTFQRNHKKPGFGRKNQWRMWFKGLPFKSSMKNWDVPLVLLERYRWTRFNGIYFVSLDLRCVRYQNLSVFCHCEFK